jgi:hypothetical protein
MVRNPERTMWSSYLGDSRKQILRKVTEPLSHISKCSKRSSNPGPPDFLAHGINSTRTLLSAVSLVPQPYSRELIAHWSSPINLATAVQKNGLNMQTVAQVAGTAVLRDEKYLCCLLG